MKQFLSKVINLVMIFVFAFLFLGIGYYIGQNYDFFNEAETVESTDESDLKLPTETEKRTVTVEEVESKLEEIQQLATYAERYEITETAEQMRYLFDKYGIPGTKNSITMTCTALIKVGYDLSDVSMRMNGDIIYIALPEAEVLDKYIIWDTVQIEEDNSILNPIEANQYEALIAEIEDDALSQAEEDGIYDLAEQHMKQIITSYLSQFEDYTIDFMN